MMWFLQIKMKSKEPTTELPVHTVDEESSTDTVENREPTTELPVHTVDDDTSTDSVENREATSEQLVCTMDNPAHTEQGVALFAAGGDKEINDQVRTASNSGF